MKNAILTKKLAIGRTLRTLQFAVENGAMAIISDYSPPNEIEDPKGHMEWHHLSFVLGLRGLVPIPSDIENIRVGGKFVNVATEFSKLIKIQFQELYIFDVEKTTGLDIQEKVSEYAVYDWFNIKRGARQTMQSIESDDMFVSKLCFYPSKRIDGNHRKLKDCYSKSYIKPEDLEKFEFSETAAKFAAMKLIKENNIKGPMRRFGSKEHRLNLVLEHDYREFRKNKKEFIINESLPSNIFLL